MAEAPGTVFAYSDFQLALLVDTLFQKVYRVADQKIDAAVMSPLLFGPLGMQDGPFLGTHRQNKSPGRLNISPRDFCRFGLLYLRQGKWRGETLLDSAWATAAWHFSLSPNLPRTGGVAAEMIQGQRSIGGSGNQEEAWGSYSNTWWTNGTNANGERLWPDAPLDTVGAFGQGGKWALVIMPGLDLVAAWVDTSLPFAKMTGKSQGRLVLNKILTRLAKTVRSH